MVKAKKTAPKKSKAEEAPGDTDAVLEDSVPNDNTEDQTEETAQENGDDGSLKKKSKGKPKKEDSEDTGEEEQPTNQQNGAGDLKKKSAPKKSAKAAKPQAEPERKSSRAPKPVTKEGTDQEGYEVEKIVDYQLQRGKPKYLIRWKGYTRAEDTWEDESSLNCPELLQKFKEENSKKSKKRSASKSPTKSAKKTKQQQKDYEVEEIVGLRIKNGKKEFKIRWKGYKASDDSWEPEKHLSCEDLISKYLEQHKDEVQDEEKKSEKKTSAKSKKTKKSKAK